nr:hypothetical protein [Tanacetum cinerariifolium]
MRKAYERCNDIPQENRALIDTFLKQESDKDYEIPEMSKNWIYNAEDSYAQPDAVLTNDDLLTKILIQLPILSIRLFTTVSKQWLRILISPDFTCNRRQISNLDPHAGLFVSHIKHSFKCDFVSFDSIIQYRKRIVENIFALASTEAGWLIGSTVWSIILEEREEDSCLVINLSGKVVEYNLISKNLHEIYDIGSNQLNDNRDDDELVMPFEADHNVYEFIPSFASV